MKYFRYVTARDHGYGTLTAYTHSTDPGLPDYLFYHRG